MDGKNTDLDIALKKCLSSRADNIETLVEIINILEKRIAPIIEYDVEAKKALHKLKGIRLKLLCDDLILMPILLARDFRSMQFGTLGGIFNNDKNDKSKTKENMET